MRLRIADRILVAIAGLLLIAACAGIAAQMFFGVDLVGFATRVFSSESTQARAALIALAVFLLILGVYCFFVLFRHRKRKDKFIMQKNESGELVISIKALENMVQKCLDQHDEIQVQRLFLETRKDGLLIRIRGSVSGGISIPLTVEALQKQIRQYVTACSGVEIRGIRVQIESSGEDAKDAPFAIAAPAGKPLLHEAEKKQEAQPAAEKAEEPVTAVPAASTVPSAPAAPAAQAEQPTQTAVIPEEDDDRPLHQRLFSPQPEPCIVPEPPAGAQEETPAAEKTVSAEGTVPSEEPDLTETFADTAEAIEELTEPAAAGESAEKPADDYVESLRAFDDLISGNGKEE